MVNTKSIILSNKVLFLESDRKQIKDKNKSETVLYFILEAVSGELPVMRGAVRQES